MRYEILKSHYKELPYVAAAYTGERILRIGLFLLPLLVYRNREADRWSET